MKALLLTAGFGTRLKPFSFLQAKASLPLLGVPFVQYPLQFLSHRGIAETVLNLHAHPETVQKAAGNHYGAVSLQYSHEPQILGTAGAMRKASSLLGSEPFIVMNGDMLLDVSLEKLREQHVRTKAAVTLVIMKSHAYQRYGGLHFQTMDHDPVPVLTGIREEYGEKHHYTGLQIVNPEILERIPENQKVEIFDSIYPELMKEGKIRGFLYDGFWMEIGTLRDYLLTSLHLLQYPLPAHLQPPNVSKSLVSPKARIEEGAVVVESIVMDGATVSAQADLDGCIVGPNTKVSARFRKAALLRGMLPWYF